MALFLPGFPFKTKKQHEYPSKTTYPIGALPARAAKIFKKSRLLSRAGGRRKLGQAFPSHLPEEMRHSRAAHGSDACLQGFEAAYRLRGSASLSFRKERPLGPLPLGPGLNKTTVLAWHWIGHQRIREPNIRSHTSMPLLGVQNMEFVRDPLCLCMQPQHKFDPDFSAQKKSALRCRHVHSIIQDRGRSP